MKFKLLHIIGARPHFMKLAPVYRAIKRAGKFEQTVIHTGQHYDRELSQGFIEEFDLPDPDVNLNTGSGSHLYQYGQILMGLDEHIPQLSPDLVFVYGDTNSTAAGAIAASKLNIPVGHIEAGLREFDKSIPEEINKLITDSVSDLLFCPTTTAVENLRNSEAVNNVHLTGDVVIDLIVKGDWSDSDKAPEDMGLHTGEYIFCTLHREANTSNRNNLESILRAFTLAERPVVFPIHPRTKKAVDKFGLQELLNAANVNVIEPIGFWETQNLIRNAKWTITDSGGVIRESYYHGVPCIITDRQTEWVEAVREGWAIIAGPSSEHILNSLNTGLAMNERSFFLGDGNASSRIAQIAADYLEQRMKQ